MSAIRFEVLNTTIFGGIIPPFSGYFCKDTQKENNLRSENKKNSFWKNTCSCIKLKIDISSNESMVKEFDVESNSDSHSFTTL